MIKAVDMFCGAGGLTHGLLLEGIDVIAGIDCDSACRYAYEHNNNHARFIKARIEDVTANEINAMYPENSTRVLVGCAPCQPFSPYAKKRSKEDKWSLLGTFADLICAVRPDIVSMENVSELKKFKGGKIYNGFVEKLTNAGYTVTASVVHCAKYGLPQDRKRLVLFASLFGPLTLIPETHTPERYRTVAHVIGQLPPIAAGEVCATDPLHRAAGLSDLNLKRIQASLPGGTWQDWKEELRAVCHKKDSGKTYKSVYGRMRWDIPSPTITTECHGYGNGRFGHPEQHRAISMREAALLQTFPQNYEFLDPEQEWHIETLGRLIGNAVPVDLGRVIARSIRAHTRRYRD